MENTIFIPKPAPPSSPSWVLSSEFTQLSGKHCYFLHSSHFLTSSHPVSPALAPGFLDFACPVQTGLSDGGASPVPCRTWPHIRPTQGITWLSNPFQWKRYVIIARCSVNLPSYGLFAFWVHCSLNFLLTYFAHFSNEVAFTCRLVWFLAWDGFRWLEIPCSIETS